MDEGVIRFQLKFSEEPPIPVSHLREINAWRKILFQLKLIGKNPDRYGGFGYGNISRLVTPYEALIRQKHFVITGSQTGDIENLTECHYCTVTGAYPEQNLVQARGPIRPSSEALTHAVLYDTDSDIRVVIHVHSPDIWKNAAKLGLIITRKNILHGTPGMADEVRRIYHETNVKDQHIFAMGGHEDGIAAFGKTFQETGFVLMHYLAMSYQFQ